VSILTVTVLTLTGQARLTLANIPTQREQARHGDLIGTLEDRSIAWISRHGAGMLLDPDQEFQGTQLVDEVLLVGKDEYRLKVTIFDENSLPSSKLIGHIALRDNIPEAVRKLPWPSRRHAAESFERLAVAPPFAVFPQDDDYSSAIARMVSPYHEGEININTAPASLLRAIIDVQHHDQLDDWLDLRREGQRISLQNPPPVLIDDLTLTDRSTMWSAFCRINHGGISTAAWLVIGRSDQGRILVLQRHWL
jgi:hypothetical protein